ncbi:NAD(P)/FAD-dependent oxidoreductase [Aspergillus neoniger CBS 115656]|uniref:FAD/NAD(P)-binding domain-containing protein n=1 Tax=Aspergillus neoniger (strain CBS 115656) TaxID=1448310 RepID=A0A318Z019_ASPNB|nr:FAD/NAD(P)-binding domain-containing protein [Aspergillus neoniger CBS 115656]PYH39774.1 FAD/NAD(P)-binding domain-containing protein [Aspergillus neoniger CBS 115656]
MEDSKKIAIIGSGAAGMAALWALHQHSPHQVCLYEAAPRLGGHINTVEFKKGEDGVNVDTGFIVLNNSTYPNFLNFLRAINVPTTPSEMSFSVSRFSDSGSFEWAGSSLRNLFAQRRNLFSLSMWRMVFDMVRFNHFAPDLLRLPDVDNTMSIGEYLEKEGYSAFFRDNYLIPLTASTWSTSPDKCNLQFPAVTLIRFLYNHNLLNTLGQGLEWLGVTNGAKSYIDTIMAGFPSERVFLNQPIVSVVNEPASGMVNITTANGTTAAYDHVILATPAPQALSLVSKTATPLEKSILSAFETTTNTAVLHSDEALLPQNRRVWSTWNYLSNGAADQVCVTYNMNRAQGVSHAKYGSVLVTMNPLSMPDERTIQGVFQYEHPLFTPAAVRAQTMLPTIQGTRGISYVGAWTMYGFHEDAFTSAFGVAGELGARLPFPVADSRLRGCAVREVSWLEYVFRMVLQGVQGLIVWLVGGGVKGKQKAR